MWTLSCDGELFGGKRLWLRPGTTHLLGRTTGRPQSGERIRYIEHKSVSRKHLIIRVGGVDAGDATRLHKRTSISLEDGSKVGTTLNDERIITTTKTLDGSKREYVIKLGHYEPLFHLVWQPVTLTFTSVGKKGKGDALAAQKQLLQGTDVKLNTEYVSNETTHVVGKKRNQPFALQALLQARWVVTYAWVDALGAAVRRDDADGNGDAKASALEEDFDGHWPKEEDYIVPAGGEPQPRPDQLMTPKPERAEVFQDFIFIFLTQSQFDSLMPIITTGGGKALLWEVTTGESKVQELAEYVREVAGEKDNSDFRLSQQTGRGGVVVVRILEKSDEWTKKFLGKAELALDQRSIEQNALLDPILTLDTSGLRQPLQESQSEMGGSMQAPVSQSRGAPRRERSVVGSPEDEAQAQAEQPPAHAQPEQEEQPIGESMTTKRRRRVVYQSRYKDFDDPDPSQYTRRGSPSPEPSFREPSQAPSVQSMNVDEPSQSVRTQQSTRKRPAPVEEEPEEEENIYDSMLPGQAALKRRKTEAARNGDNNSFSKAAIEADRVAIEKASKVKKRREKQVDIKAELKARRDREEEQRQKDDESLREQMAGIDIKQLRNLAVVEEMEIPVRERPSRQANAAGRSERWDPAWNGRKNFKKFRPQGQRSDVPRLQRVIVALEEVPRKGHGIGDEYWLTSTAPSGKGKSKSQSQSQSQSVRAEPSSEDTGDVARFRRRIQKSREEDAEDADHDEVHPAEIAGHARDPGLEALANGAPSQTLRTESQRKAAGKRPATQQGGGPAKKAKQTTLPARNTNVANVEEDDDDDGLKFKRRRR
ncbi:hypothetical protein LTR36_001368 [Oleoguttula mirabilis]|uniref:FHA domain-containing protein n=1 Tax=Oleoguttula mirabilis TaxID=1507867 RepID=A0AAV9JQ85_9PEZI|nr:hypothetical protein LTR36_001368 [Oleoguttula mirabilis]